MKKVLILMLLGFVVGVNAITPWELIKEKNGITLFSLQKQSYELKHYKAQTLINKDADTILAALQDTEACPEWVYHCISNEMVEMIDVQQRIYHTIIHSPLWFKDRDFYIKSQVNYDPKQRLFTIGFISKPDYAKAAEDKVRITDVEMTWRLKYLSDQETEVTYQIYIDPKLPLKPINHLMIKKSVIKTMQGLKELVENPIYGETKYSESELEMLTEDN